DDLPLPRGPRRRAEEVVAKLDRVVLRDQLRGRLHVPLGKAVASAHQGGKLVEDFFGAGDVGRFAFDNQVAAGRTDPYRELPFEVLEVFVVGAEQGFSSLSRDLNLAHRRGWQSSLLRS